MKSSELKRIEFIKAAGVLSVAGLALLPGCKDSDAEDVLPAEDLMREHGLLNRVLLIYDTCKLHLAGNENFEMQVLVNSAGIIRSFVEDYHEKMEEDFLFPRFEKANVLTDLVKVLRQQHDAGRRLTDQVAHLAGLKTPSDTEKQELVSVLNRFNIMYRPHEAREDTVLFPAIRKIVSAHEYDSLGEDFEKKEHDMFGKDGFEVMVDKVAGLEKQLGIYELAQFTPKL